MFKKVLVVMFSVLLVAVLSCSKSSTEPEDPNSDIPPNPANINVPATVFNNLIPSATFQKVSGNESRIKVNLLGLVDPSTGTPIELDANYGGTTYNTFLEEDSILQGLKLTKVSTGNVLKSDIVFTVDNSGSMSQESDSVAARIIDFATFLTNSGLDAVFGCVGYYGEVTGAINLTDQTQLASFLNRNTGTYRTKGFAGPDSALFDSLANIYAPGVSGENGVVAILFADSLFSWRAGSQRIFINFTDEPTQPNYIEKWSTSNLCNELLGRATVHTVFSRDSSYYSWTPLYRERPWKMSECTGGTMKFIPSDASGLDLTTLPVAGALANSYLLEYVTGNPNGTHTVTITVKTASVDGKIVYTDISY